MPLVIAHAAAAGEAPANTLAGVRAALRSADAIEIDVRLSAGGTPVLMHDPTVDRTTNLSGEVRQLTAGQLAAADAGEGEPVPTLSEVLQLVQGQAAVFCELKATPEDPAEDERLVAAVLRVLDEHNAVAWAGIHSFSPAMIEWARQSDARISTAVIARELPSTEVQQFLTGAVERGCQAVSVRHTLVDAALVRAARSRQLTIWCWTPDDEAEWRRLVDAGVDGIITNHPARLRQFLGA